jgi:hypothetical protein
MMLTPVVEKFATSAVRFVPYGTITVIWVPEITPWQSFVTPSFAFNAAVKMNSVISFSAPPAALIAACRIKSQEARATKRKKMNKQNIMDLELVILPPPRYDRF